MASPSVSLKSSPLQAGAAGFLVRGVPVQPLVHTKTVIIPLEKHQLSLQIRHVPNEQMIQILPTDGPDESFRERMRPGNVRHRLHCLHPQHPEVGLPALELKQGIVVETEPDGETLFSGTASGPSKTALPPSTPPTI
jgi:hypothetical protein